MSRAATPRGEVGVALLGCGAIGLAVHLPELRRLPGARVLSIADVQPERRALAAKLVPGAIACGHYADALDVEGVHAAVICLPTGLHAEAAVDAFARGKHVYLEKPIATTLDAGRSVVEAWRARGTVGMIGFNYRFHPLLVELREVVRSGRLGEIVLVRSALTSPPGRIAPWKRERKSGGGALLDLASHHVDLARFVLGREALQVFAAVRSSSSEDDTASLHVRLDGEVFFSSQVSLTAAESDTFEVLGTKGAASVDRLRSLAVEVMHARADLSRRGRLLRASGPVAALATSWRRFAAPLREPSFGRALGAFVDAAHAGRQAGPDLTDGLRSLEVIAAAEESAAAGRPVSVPVAAR